ncbi:TetR/AcrR family transcriptional regulator [Nakamurella leprariae]|uniref:TetR/AcrR family transcriptional regulator n=1 Tax=Nakamurella leprariae TaxID=2803911 RepID=A0A939C0R2_9ACTN|nr:TetR/AcrR family transcriptional regulator [Nakamurella leprariae]MBM9469046.1 TetR/AcrR family transcriptional regulator [Nakamurella leprariae]
MPGASSFHQQVAADKRAAILTAATALFGEQGYGRTSLAQIATAAQVSKATLFKQFPTKSHVFDAIVDEVWGRSTEPTAPTDPADPRTGLRALGTEYAELLSRPGMAGLFRLVIAEAPSFPELGRRQFDLGKLPFFDEVCRYFQAAAAAGSLHVQDPTMATTQMLGMISNFVLWPRMFLIDWAPDGESVAGAVEEAVLTVLARYGVPDRPASD